LTAPVQVLLSTGIAAAVYVAGLEPVWRGTVGLCVLSSSVVIVNITVSRRRRPTADRGGVARLERIRTSSASRWRRSCWRRSTPGGGRARPARLAGFARTLAVARILPRVLRRCATSTIVPDRVGRVRPAPRAWAAPCTRGPAWRVRRRMAVTEPRADEADAGCGRSAMPAVFFVAIGTLVDPDGSGRGAWIVLRCARAVAKVGVAGAGRVARLEARPLQLAVGLGQIGEFSSCWPRRPSPRRDRRGLFTRSSRRSR
jgi:hypothetical protein